MFHVGNARSLLLNRAVARQSGGTMVLRIGDTDAARSRPKVFTTDRNSIVVQGDLVTSLDSPDGEAVVEIPRQVWEEAARALGG